MRSLFPTPVTRQRLSLLASIYSVLRGLIESLILLYLPPGSGALLAQAVNWWRAVQRCDDKLRAAAHGNA